MTNRKRNDNARKGKIIRPFAIQYFFWGHVRSKKADGRGHCELLQEAYANAAKHLGRGSVYYKAVIIDRENEKIVAILTRTMGNISIEEK